MTYDKAIVMLENDLHNLLYTYNHSRDDIVSNIRMNRYMCMTESVEYRDKLFIESDDKQGILSKIVDKFKTFIKMVIDKIKSIFVKKKQIGENKVVQVPKNVITRFKNLPGLKKRIIRVMTITGALFAVDRVIARKQEKEQSEKLRKEIEEYNRRVEEEVDRKNKESREAHEAFQKEMEERKRLKEEKNLVEINCKTLYGYYNDAMNLLNELSNKNSSILNREDVKDQATAKQCLNDMVAVVSEVNDLISETDKKLASVETKGSKDSETRDKLREDFSNRGNAIKDIMRQEIDIGVDSWGN